MKKLSLHLVNGDQRATLAEVSPCVKCGGTDFGIWTSARTEKQQRYCRPCRRIRAAAYSLRKAKSEGRHTRRQWLKELSQHSFCPQCKRRWEEIPPRPDHRYKYVWTKDHIIPLSQGGSDSIENIQPLCYQCNSSKCNTINWERRVYKGSEQACSR
jgi:5-methylcytosine-specific restriction endonuclease McrA